MTTTTGFIYIRQPSTRQPVGCVAYQAEGDTVKFAYSVCAKEDEKKFSKDLARTIASKRLEKTETEVKVTGTRHVIVRSILGELKKSNISKVKRFSEFWLKQHPVQQPTNA